MNIAKNIQIFSKRISKFVKICNAYTAHFWVHRFWGRLSSGGCLTNVSRISSWNFVRVPKVCLALGTQTKVQLLQYIHFERICWGARETLVKHPPSPVNLSYTNIGIAVGHHCVGSCPSQKLCWESADGVLRLDRVLPYKWLWLLMTLNTFSTK